VFKVQAFVPGDPVPAWTFSPNSKQGLQLALAVAVGPYGEVYGGGVAVDDQPAFKRIPGCQASFRRRRRRRPPGASTVWLAHPAAA
jgi:hypothetical protein